jgi:galactofuranosylgalactofuranosylrhamnosyl-N-acetylglucosaminyl-diphospho-decaprenol beta-1,5/1,6-galactofuranosyltransferase
MAARPHRTETVEPAGVAPAVPDEPSAPTRLVVQRGLFFGPSALVPEDLYAVVSRGGARRERHRVVLDPHSAVGTNTYWGRFHATYWQRWTAVGEVEVTARVSGTGRVRLMASDANKVWRIVAAEDVADADGLTVRLVALIDRFVDGGGLWLELTTESAPMTVEDVRWSVVAPRPQRPTSVVICTYNRVDDCLNTLAAMADDPGAGEAVESVVVVDQGSDPLESRRASPRSASGSAPGCGMCASPTSAARAVSPAACSTPRRVIRPKTTTSCSWTTTCCSNPRS